MSDNESPYVAECSICGNGLLGIFRCGGCKSTVAICDECELMWADVAAVAANSNNRSDGSFPKCCNCNADDPGWTKLDYAGISSAGLAGAVKNPPSQQPLPGLKQFDMTGRIAVVTGGSKGLGAAMAAGLASAGASVVITSRHADEANAAAAQIAADFGNPAIAFEADVTSTDECQYVVTETLNRFGKIDVLINNAGINIRGPIEELTLEEFRQVQNVNVDGIWLMCRTVIPHMKSAGYGRIVNMASTLGLVGLADRTPYATSKGAVVQMTRALGLELAKTGVTCNAICPGPFLTPMNVPIANDEQTMKFIVGAVAMERWGYLREIQGAAILLASEASSYMTGSMLTVDGGWTAR